MERRITKLLGLNIDKFSFEEAVSYAKDLIMSQKGGQIVTINPEMTEIGKNLPEFAQIVNDADLVIPDGVGIKIGLKILGENSPRIAGIEFSHKLIEECSNSGKSVGLLGAKPYIVTKAAQNLKNEFPNLNISYIQDGYFTDENAVITELQKSKPDLLLVALGCPKQEFFISNARKTIPEALMIGVGGSFDVWSGEIERAPIFFQKIGLEWFYRTIKEPKRFKRIFPTLPLFVFRVILSKFK